MRRFVDCPFAWRKHRCLFLPSNQTFPRDLDVKDGPGYEFEVDESRQKYCGRVIVSFHNKVQNLIRNASTVLHKCYVAEVLESAYKDDEFPGYDEVDLAWQDLARVIDNKVWKSALENQKGVYLISDQSNGKQYVGSAYGEQMLHGRWSRYVNNYHGGNVELMTLDDNHIRTQFRYSILETYRSTTADDLILRRENWWKRVLQTREFGYNKN